MGICHNLIYVCTGSHKPCPYIKMNGYCENSDCQHVRNVTFGEAFDIFVKVKDINPTRTLKEYKKYNATKSSLDKVYNILGFNADTPVILFDRVAAKKFKEEALKKYAAITVRDALVKIYALLSDEFIEEYEARGLEIPTLRKITVSSSDVGKDGSTTDTGKEELTSEQVIAIRNFMMRHRELALKGSTHTQRLYSRRMTLLFFLCVCMGCRKGDAFRISWSNFVTISGRLYLKYKAHKNGAKVVREVTTDAYDFIMPLRQCQSPEDVCVPPGGKSNTKSIKHGIYCGTQYELSNNANKFLRLIGLDGRGGLQALRAYSGQITFGLKGAIAEAESLGHTPTVGAGHYYHVNNESYGK